MGNNPSIIKPNSTIFNKKPTENAIQPLNFTIINNNNYNLGNMQSIQPKIKIREVIKIADYEKQNKKERTKARKCSEERHFEQLIEDMNRIDSDDGDEDFEENEREEKMTMKKRRRTALKFNKNKKTNNERGNNNFMKNVNNLKNNQNENKIKSIKSIIDSSKKFKKEKIRDFAKTNANEKNTNTFIISNNLNNNISNNNIDNYNAKPIRVKKTKLVVEQQQEKVYRFDNIETNKFTKKIVEDTINKNFAYINYNKVDSDVVLSKRGNDDKLFGKGTRRKLRRSKKTDVTRAEITMIEKDPVSINDIQCKISINIIYSFYLLLIRSTK